MKLKVMGTGVLLETASSDQLLASFSTLEKYCDKTHKMYFL